MTLPMDENPYAAPRGALQGEPRLPPLPGWSAARLRLLGWLGLASALGALVVMLLSLPFGGGMLHATGYAYWLGLITVLLGDYLLLRFKSFVEARFAARGLSWPVWLCILLSLLLEVADPFLESSFHAFGWSALFFGLALIVYGGLTVWLGVRLRKVSGAYRALRVMAWLLIAGGLMLASLILALPAMLPLLGASLAQSRVFFRGCAEVRAQR